MGEKRVLTETIGFLSRLRRDVRGNTLAFMAALLVPLAALSGSAIDVARMYAVKTRLQQACDAGALAGRKSMTADGTLDTSATGPAQSFFKNNFQSGWFKTNAVSFTPTKTTENQVAGSATATVPMTVMSMFGMQSRVVNVTCEARYDVADADIVFVLDTTGSMACQTTQSDCLTYATSSQNVVQNADGSYSVKEKTSSRIDGLRSAVSTFYNTLTTHADPTTHFRFGFVPYAATANVGGLLNTSYLNQAWRYQSRTPVESPNGSATTNTTTNTTEAACNALAGKTYKTDPSANPVYSAVNITVTSWTTASGGTCKTSKQNIKISWHYAQTPSTAPIDVSGYIASLTTGVGVTNPAMIDGSKSVWAGCVEERYTAPGVSNPSTTSPPLDLDVDTAPTDQNSRWSPWWPEVEFWRNSSTSEDSTGYREIWARSTSATDTSAKAGNQIGCPKAAKRLQTMTATDITNYLSAANGFRPYGYTYHDIGITWGTRLLSPNGIFKADTQAWTGHNAPNRYIVFLTDGDMENAPTVYGAHGMEQFDKRVMGSTSVTTSNMETYHNNRFAAACTIAKNHNITIFVIAYAQTLTTQLTNCASPGKAYTAANTDALNTAFADIAKQVAMLRLSK